ncbi:MAG TPA: hypothetical protein VMN56_10025 [Casimicrobiaceae bacterium]|nr:hypothetical protein [Casimicrobiaceae bacterium]
MARPSLSTALAAIVLAASASAVHAAKVTDCAKVGVCYCINDDHKPAIDANVEKFRQLLADQRKAGKAVIYLSVPLTSGGGGNFDVNKEVAASIKAAVEKRFGADYVYAFSPLVDLPRGAGGAEYMVMWTALLEGQDGLGAFDAAFFAGPGDFARYFKFDGNNDMGKLDAYFDNRAATNADFARAVQNGLTKEAFRKYYALRASTTVSRGAHDEWNIFRLINEKRRADGKLGTPAQIPIVFDGQGVAPATAETADSEGYTGKCPM